MEIRGANFQGYDKGHIGAVQRELAKSIKPNVLRQLETLEDEQKIAFLLTTDMLDLSPDAREYLYKLRKRMREEGKSRGFAQASKQDFAALLAGLEQLKEELARDEAENYEPLPSEPLFPSVIQLSSYVPRQGRGSGESEPEPESPAAALLKRMIRFAPSDQARGQMIRELEPMGEVIVAKLKQWGLNIIVLERNVSLTDLTIKGMRIVAPGEKTFDGRPWSQVRGLYDQSRRLLVVGEELLANKGRSAARHEFAHAYDHFVQEKESRTHPLSVQLYNRFSSERTGTVSDYARVNPQEWFAESVEAFFEEGARDLLRSRDPQMYGYLQQLFGMN